jgi:hypothetical protein
MSKLHRPMTIAVVVAAALVPATAGAQEFASPDARDRAAAAAPVLQDLRSPDVRDRAAAAAAVASAPVVQDLRSPDARDSALGVQQPVAAPAPVTTSSSSTAFNWSDAFIGAGSALALLLLLGGTAFLAVHFWHGHGRGGGRPTHA